MVTGQRTRSPSRGRGGHNVGAPRAHSESPRAPRKRGGRRQPQGLVTAPFPHTHSRPLEWCNPPLIQKRLQSQWADPASFSPSTTQSVTRLPPLGWPGPCPGPWERFTPWCRRRLRRARKHSRGRVRQSCTCHCRSRRQEMKRQTWFSFNNVIQSPLLMPKVAILRFPQMRIRFLLETGFLARLPAWRAAPPDYSRPVSSCW